MKVCAEEAPSTVAFTPLTDHVAFVTIILGFVDHEVRMASMQLMFMCLSCNVCSCSVPTFRSAYAFSNLIQSVSLCPITAQFGYGVFNIPCIFHVR